jgi:hypothetical protein
MGLACFPSVKCENSIENSHEKVIDAVFIWHPAGTRQSGHVSAGAEQPHFCLRIRSVKQSFRPHLLNANFIY